MFTSSPQVVVVGAGLSGAVLAERFASRNQKVLVIEKRNHVGGNCFDYYNEEGLLVSKYGAHIFHTNEEEVWSYVNEFADWYPYEHRVYAKVDGNLVPVPVNIQTVNVLLKMNIQNEKEMKDWLARVQRKKKFMRNAEEAGRARVGDFLYEKIFKNYTAKQWGTDPNNIDASVLNRIPVRTNFENRYFTDKYQALPVGGYTKFVQKILSHKNIQVLLNTDFFDIRDRVQSGEKLFYTGPIDRYFDFKFNLKKKLEYRSLRFEHQTLNQEFYQNSAVVNYPNEEEFTRIVEYKHLTKQKHPFTTIVREYPTWEGEPYYPVPSSSNRRIYNLYKKESDMLRDVFFAGRLANYKYFNMDEAIKNSLDLANNLYE